MWLRVFAMFSVQRRWIVFEERLAIVLMSFALLPPYFTFCNTTTVFIWAKRSKWDTVIFYHRIYQINSYRIWQWSVIWNGVHLFDEDTIRLCVCLIWRISDSHLSFSHSNEMCFAKYYAMKTGIQFIFIFDSINVEVHLFACS